MIKRLKTAWAALTAQQYVVIVDMGRTSTYSQHASKRFLRLVGNMLAMEYATIDREEKGQEGKEDEDQTV